MGTRKYSKMIADSKPASKCPKMSKALFRIRWTPTPGSPESSLCHTPFPGLEHPWRMRPGSRAGIASRAARHQFHQQLEKKVRHSAWQDAKAENAWRGVKNGAVARLVANVSCSDNPSSIIPPFPAFHSGHDFLSGQELFQVSCDPGLFIVRFVMTRCTALEFRSQAVTFAGNRLLLVTTVQIGACVGWQDKDVTKTSPRKCHCKQEHEDELQMKLHIHPKVQVKHKVLQNYSRKAFVNFVPSTWHHRPPSAHPISLAL